MRAPPAQVTVLWGASAIAVGRVARGGAVSIAADGVIRPLVVGDSIEEGAVVVEALAPGACMWSIELGPTPRAGGRVCVVAGQVAEHAIGARDRTSIYRATQTAQSALAVRVEIADELLAGAHAPVVASRPLATTLGSATAHALAFAAAVLSPPAAATAIASEVSTRWYFDVDAAEASETPPQPPPRVTEEWSGAAPQYCQDLEGRPLSAPIELQGPQDNPDPHLASRRSVLDGGVEWVLGPTRGSTGAGWEEPIAPWGREDSLGRDERSAMYAISGPHMCRRESSCFGEPRLPWSCHSEKLELPSIVRVGLTGIGDDPVVPEDPWRWHRSPRVVVGPRMIAANVPRWAVTASLASVEDHARACYDRMLADDPHVTGALEIAVRVRGEETVTEVTPRGGLTAAPELACCVREAHAYVHYELPRGTRANVLYRIDFGAETTNRTPASRIR